MTDLRLRVDGRLVTLIPGAPLTIGRSPEATIVVKTPTVSRIHLTVEPDPYGWIGRDHETLNGTYVDGLQLPSGGIVPLRPGMTLTLGPPGEGLDVQVLEAEHAPALAAPLAVKPYSVDPMQGLTISRDSLRTGNITSSGASLRGLVPRTDTLTIGRAPDNSIGIADPMVSGHHARMRRTGPGQWQIEDLRSMNGTFVNGRRIVSELVNAGDVVSVSKVFLRVTTDGLERLAQAPHVTPAQTGSFPVPGTRPDSLTVSRVTFSVPDHGRSGQRKVLLDDVTFNVGVNSLLAVIGPSGAGKSTLLKAITGANTPDSGQVLFNGLDMAVYADALAGNVGMVPQDDLVHVDLTARQALDYAARLRFPDDVDQSTRREAVDWAIGELGLTQHADTRIKQMSGGQRKRVSTAMELLTKPSLLILDEPTSGLDPNLDAEVMELLRKLSRGGGEQGRTVLVITHSTANLDKADNVLLLAPGGKVAYIGPPSGLRPFFAQPDLPEPDYPHIYKGIVAQPDGAKATFARSPLAPRPVPYVPKPPANTPLSAPRRRPLPQTLTLVSRQFKLMLADRSLLAFTLALPVVIGLITLAVQAKNGFNASETSKTLGHPRILMVVLIFGAVLMGMVPSVRQLVGERPIFKREAGVGLRPDAYLASKLVLLAVVSLIQSMLLVAVTLAVNDHPPTGVLWPLGVELFVIVFWVTWACAAIGLLLSALVTTSEQVMPLMVVVLMAQLVLCGGVLDVTGAGVNQASWATPSRWGLAAGATSLDFNRIITCHGQQMSSDKADEEINKQAKEATDKANQEAADAAKKQGLPAPEPKVADVRHTVVDCATIEDTDPLWAHNATRWFLSVGMLILLFGLSSAATYLVLRRQIR